MRVDLGALRGALRQLPADRNGVEFSFRLDAAVAGLGCGLERPATVQATLRDAGRALRAHVRGHVDLICPCDRCLGPVACGLDVAYVEEFLTPVQGAAVGLPVDGDDDGTLRRVVVSGDSLSLDEGFWQHVSLALPMKRLCRSGCRGICPQCGCDRNVEPCACGDDAVDPRLAALVRWLPEREEG